MPVPHDFYSPWSDHPHLHNRHHSRPYVEPDWQAHAAGHQLPVLSTIGRGPRGYGMKVANYEADEKSFKFDIVCDDPHEEIQHIGPIPSGELILGQEAGAITLSSPYLKNDGSIGYKMQRIELPEAEPGSRVFTHLDSVPYQEDGFYDLDAFNLTYSNRRDTENLPEVRDWDSIIFKATDEEENDYLLVGDVLNATVQSDLVVGVHLEIPIANLTGEQGPKGDKGDKGNKGDAATISVGTVTTGNPGTQAAVINSGTNSSAVFDFTIPQGAKGDKGDTGNQGTPGESAYDIAVDEGFAGTELEWLESLVGPQGPAGPTGPAGASPKYKIVRCVLDLEQFASADWVSNACSKTYNLPATAPSGYQPLGILGTLVEQPSGVIVTGAYLTDNLSNRKLVVNYYKTPTYSGQGDVGWEIDVLYVETGQISSIQQGVVTSAN